MYISLLLLGEYCESSMFSEADYQESQLSHSMASTNQQILRELARDLMQVSVAHCKTLIYIQCNPQWENLREHLERIK